MVFFKHFNHTGFASLCIFINYAVIICFRSVLRRKNRFKKGSTGWKKYQNKLSNTNGRNTSAVQLPAQAAAMNTPPAEEPTQVDAPTSQQSAQQLELSSEKPDNAAFTDFLLASGFANSNFVGVKLPGY